MRLRRPAKVAVAVLGAFAAVQLVPYGRDHANPAVIIEPTWDSSSTRALAVRACFDCHSNLTHRPWYAHIAPVSWLVQHDVAEGRGELNFSEWNRDYPEADASAEAVLDGEMPPAIYRWLHPAARLSAEERRALADGLTTTLSRSRAGPAR